MCGIFLSITKKIQKSNILKSDINNIKHYIGPRGPDRFNIYNHDNVLAIHSQLIITGDRPQPITNEDYLLLFNGEIYNDYSNYSSDPFHSDTDYLTEKYESLGMNNSK